MSQPGQKKRPPKHYLRSIYPSEDMMTEVENIIAREQQNPTHEQTAESPTGKNHLSSTFPSRENEDFVMGLVRQLEK